MKLNNKGFAITSVLYGLLILFVSLVGTYLAVLLSKMNKLDNISDDINDKYGFNTCLNKNADGECTEIKSNSPTVSCHVEYTVEYTGKYIFQDSTNKNCITYLKKGEKYITDDFKFTDSSCSYNCYSDTGDLYLMQVYYNGDDSDE